MVSVFLVFQSLWNLAGNLAAYTDWNFGTFVSGIALVVVYYDDGFAEAVGELETPYHDDFIEWKYFSRYWPFVGGIHRSPVNSPHKVQCRGALMFSLICAWINGWVNNREAGDLGHHRVHYDVTVMWFVETVCTCLQQTEQNPLDPVSIWKSYFGV